MSLDLDEMYVRKAIAGDRKALFAAFDWETTPQGYKYWDNQWIGNVAYRTIAPKGG